MLFYDDFRRDPADVTRRVFRFLGVSTDVPVNTERSANVGETPRFRLLRHLLWDDNLLKACAQRLIPAATRRAVSTWLDSKNRRPIPELEDDRRAELAERFQEDQQELTALLERQLPW